MNENTNANNNNNTVNDVASRYNTNVDFASITGADDVPEPKYICTEELLKVAVSLSLKSWKEENGGDESKGGPVLSVTVGDTKIVMSYLVERGRRKYSLELTEGGQRLLQYDERDQEVCVVCQRFFALKRVEQATVLNNRKLAALSKFRA